MTVAALLYICIQAVCIGTLPDLANSQRPLADVGAHLFGGQGAAFISFGALISIMGTMNAIVLAAARLPFAMAERGQLPAVIAATHRRFHTPHVALFISAVGMLVLTLSGTFASAALLSTIIRLTTYAVTCAALPVLRRKSGQTSAPFTVPAGRIVSNAALLLILWLFSSSSWPEARQALSRRRRRAAFVCRVCGTTTAARLRRQSCEEIAYALLRDRYFRARFLLKGDRSARSDDHLRMPPVILSAKSSSCLRGQADGLVVFAPLNQVSRFLHTIDRSTCDANATGLDRASFGPVEALHGLSRCQTSQSHVKCAVFRRIC
jgi:amino acid transporter